VPTIFDDLEAEQDRLEEILDGFDAAEWDMPSAAPGWTIADVILHLAQTEETVVQVVASTDEPVWRKGDATTDAYVEVWVQSQRAPGLETFERWKHARRAAVAALRATDPKRPLQWVTRPLRAQTLATTRLAEHWAHALDVTEPFGIPLPDTDRLRHIAWLGHRTLPYAFELDGQEPHELYAELKSPRGETWTFGDAGAPSRVTGEASAFCRVGARRLAPAESGLIAEGPYADAALRVLRNYAG